MGAPVTPAVLRGGRVLLRPFREEEHDRVWETFVNGNGFAHPLPDLPPREKVEERLRRSGTLVEGMLDLALEAEGRLIGHIQARRPENALPPGVFDLGITIYEARDRGKGHGTEAVSLITRHLFEDLDAGRVQLSTDVENGPMRGAAERAGFRPEGVMRGFMPTVDGPRDYLLYAMTREDRPSA